MGSSCPLCTLQSLALASFSFVVGTNLPLSVILARHLCCTLCGPTAAAPLLPATGWTEDLTSCLPSSFGSFVHCAIRDMKAQLLFLCAFKTAILSSHHVRVVGAQDGGEEEADSCRTCATNNASSASSGPDDESIVLGDCGDNVVSSDESPGYVYVYPPPVSHSNYNQHNDGDEPSAPSLFIRPS